MKLTKSAAIFAASAVALLGATAMANAGGLNDVEKKLAPLAAKEGSVRIIHPLFSDRTARRVTKAFKKRYNLPDSFEFNSLRKGTGSTVAQTRQEIKAGKFTISLIVGTASQTRISTVPNPG